MIIKREKYQRAHYSFLKSFGLQLMTQELYAAWSHPQKDVSGLAFEEAF